MSDERARELVRIATQLKNERSTWEAHWQEISDVLRPQVQPFTSTTNSPTGGGEKRTAKMFDAVPPLALEKFAAVMEALISPRNQVWSKLTVDDDGELDDDTDVQRYLEAVNKALFKARYRPQSNLASQLAESYLNLGAFGTQVLYVGDDVGRAMVYRSCGLHNVLVGEDQHGRSNQVFRHYEFNAEQAVRAFVGDAVRGNPALNRDDVFNRLPVSIRTAYDRKSLQRFKFLHAVVQRDVVEDTRLDYRGMAWASCHVFEGENTTMSEGGFRTMPYCVSRYSKNSEEIYGRSPGMLILGDANQLNRMNKSVTKAGERVNDPPLMMADDSLAAFNLTPGAFNYGTLNDQGEPLVKPFVSGSKIEIGHDMMEQKREIIREAFLLDIFQALMDAPRLNMMQIMEIVKEKAALISPIMGRQQSELFGPMTDRELDILAHAGQLPPMPEALIERSGEVTVEYTSPWAMAQRAETGAGIMRTFEAIAPLEKLPEASEAMRIFDIKKTFRELAQINSFPAKALRSDDEVKALDEQAAARQQAADLVQGAPVMAQSMKSMAEAQAALTPGSLNGNG